MKNSLQDIRNTKLIKEALDQAVDNMDIEQIDEYMTKLQESMPLPGVVEDSKLFAKKIIIKEKKGIDIMKKNHRKVASFIAGLVILGGAGVTSYATGMWSRFDFFEEDRTVTVSSNEHMTKAEAEEFMNNQGQTTGAPTVKADQSTTTLNTLEEVKDKLGVDVAVPKYIPEDFKMSDEIETYTIKYGEAGVHNLIYITYHSEEDEKRRFGIAVEKKEWKDVFTTMSEMEATYKGKYDSKTGNQYTLYDEEGTILAETCMDNIIYTFAFMGVSEAEIYKTIDSTDLGVYKQQ